MPTKEFSMVGINPRWLRCSRPFIVLAALGALPACGGGGGSGGSGNLLSPSPAPPAAYVAGTYAASATFAGHCAAPRSGTNPATARAYTDVAGSTLWENNWLRSWSRELYLWYRELPDLNPSSSSSTQSFFDLLKTNAISTTGSGKPKDQFHFTYPTPDWIALSQSGVSAGYGVEFVVTAAAPPRVVIAAYTEPGSPATAASITRGVRVLKVDGVDIVNGNISAWPEGLFPDAANEPHTFLIADPNGTQRTISMTSANVTSTPVQNIAVISTPNGPVGYLLFNDHIATAEQQLIAAFTTFKNNNVTDLVLDIRYNGGGYLDIASEVAYMIAGSTATANRTFELTQFNDQYPGVNPVTRNAITPVLFHNTAQGFSATAGTALPSLNLSQVFLLTGSNTCSASESIINSLNGIGVRVIQIGSTTCGKPYGFYPQDNCGTTYFTIEFKGINNVGFGDYTDGFTPNNATGNTIPRLPGCSVADDFTHALGNQSEARLAAALFYRNNQTCSSGPTGIAGRSTIQAVSGDDAASGDGYMVKTPARENRIVTR
jgi:carboxyl-terminal processing protease